MDALITLREVRLLRIVQEAINASARNDSRPHWAGVICPSCGTDYRSVSAVDGEARYNPNHDPNTGEFSSGGGAGKGKNRSKALERLQDKYYRNPVQRWPDIHGKNLKGKPDTYHVEVVKNAYKFDEPSEPRYYTRAIEHSTKNVDDSVGHNKLSNAIKAGNRMHAYYSREATRSVSGLFELRAFPKTKIQKAGSAESMLRYCLSQRGWTKQYQRGQLTGQQHLELLEDVRLYGRAWLRHEAEQFARSYLSLSDGRRSGSLIVGSDSLDRQIRADKWIPGPGGFLYLEDRPSFISNVGRFFRRVKNFVREHIVAGAMALLGPQPLTGEEHNAAEREAQKQEQFFDRFHEELKQSGPPRPTPKPVPIDTTSMIIDVFPPPITPGEFVARVESYGNAAWQAAQRISTQSAAQIFRLERRVLGIPKTEHCTDCPPLAEKGWVPIGTLPPIGETECNGACLCSFRYKEAPEGREYFRGRKGPVPAPPYPKAEPLPEEFANEVEMIAEPPGVQINVPVAGPPAK